MKRKFNELTIKDSFMFAAVMSDPRQCRKLLELALGMEILEVSIMTEKVLNYNPDYRGVRLDVLAVENGTKRRFNVEMQVRMEPDLPQRVRYYHSQMDMDLLAAGQSYDQLPNTYVIFICDFTPFPGERKLYRYTFQSQCAENGQVLDDGRMTVVLSTKGENDDEVPAELVRFLKYVENPAGMENTIDDDSYVHALREQIAAIKKNRNWEAKYVRLQDLINEERAEARQEGIEQGKIQRSRESVLELLEDLGEIPEDIKRLINAQSDEEILKQWLLKAARADTIEQFRNTIR